MSSPESLVGRLIDQFRLDQFIAKGAMGMVFKAFDTVLIRTVALKLISKRIEEDQNTDEQASREEARKRLIQEAKAAGRLAHPNIVTIHSYGETDEFEYICMEFVPGRTLTQLLHEQGVIHTEQAIHIFEQILYALDAANKEQIVHRDIKPSNIMITHDQRVKVMDFGIAKLPSFSMTTTGTVLGTPYYMSPEQITGQKVDIRSDIFSVGAVLYQILTGERPFEAANTATLAYKIVQVDPIPPDVLNIHIPHPLGDVVRKALAKSPADRYQTPSEMMRDLRAVKQRQMAAGEDESDATVKADLQLAEQTVMAKKVEGAKEVVSKSPPLRPPGEDSIPSPTPSFEAASPKIRLVPKEMKALDEELEPTPSPPPKVEPPRPSPPPPEATEAGPKGKEPAAEREDARVAQARPPKAEKKTPSPAAQKVPQPQKAQPSSLKTFGIVAILLLFVGIGVVVVFRQFESSRQPGVSSPGGIQEPPGGVPRGQPVDPQVKTSVDSLIVQARNQLESNPANAQGLLEEAIRLDPNSFEAYLQLGRLLTLRKDFPAAVQHYQNALRLNDQSADVYFNLGYIYLSTGNYDSAIQNYESCWALLPPYQDEVLTNLGISYMKKHNSERAQALFRQALELNPYNTVARSYVTTAPLTQTQEPLPAVSQSDTAASQARSSVESMILEAKNQWESNPSSAQKLLEEAVALNPNHFDAHLQLGRLLTFRKDFPNAVKQYQIALRLNSQAPEVYFNLGYIYLSMKDYDAAIQSYETCRALSPPYLDEVLTNLGIGYLRKNNHTHARSLFKQALDLNPKNDVARTYMRNLDKVSGAQSASVPGVAPTSSPAKAGTPQAEAVRVEGKYTVEGVNPSGSRYQGTAVISRDGDQYAMTWNIANKTFSGSGTLAGDSLTINWTASGGAGGVVVYNVLAGGVLKGAWADGSGSETLVPVR